MPTGNRAACLLARWNHPYCAYPSSHASGPAAVAFATKVLSKKEEWSVEEARRESAGPLPEEVL